MSNNAEILQTVSEITNFFKFFFRWHPLRHNRITVTSVVTNLENLKVKRPYRRFSIFFFKWTNWLPIICYTPLYKFSVITAQLKSSCCFFAPMKTWMLNIIFNFIKILLMLLITVTGSLINLWEVPARKIWVRQFIAVKYNQFIPQWLPAWSTLKK